MLELDEVFFGYSDKPEKTGDWTLAGVSLEVAEGEFLGIAGPTGSGKSTLAQVLCGLIKPNRGSVLLDGSPLAWKRKTGRAHVGMALQYPERQLFGATVLEDVAFGPKNLGASEKEAVQRAEETLLQVGLDPETVGEANPFNLSGGQQRKVALAGVLSLKPEYLILDEPAAGLDPAAHAEMIELIRTLNSRDGIAVVMISHSMEDLAANCQRIILLNEGKTFAQGTPEQVFADAEAVESIGLEIPAATEFLAKLKKAGIIPPSEVDFVRDSESLSGIIAEYLAR